MNKGYNDAISLGEEKLETMNPAEICENCGVKWENGEFYIPWFGVDRGLSSGNEVEKVLWLHYLTAEGIKKATGSWIAYREVPGARFYEEKFVARAVRPLIKTFGDNPSGLIATGEKIGGVKSEPGDASITVNLLPYIPVTYILWGKDSEFPPDANILFDKTATSWFVSEDLVVLASLGAYKLAQLAKET